MTSPSSALMGFAGAAACLCALLPCVPHWAVWAFLVPRLSTHDLAIKSGRPGKFVRIQGFEIYYERYVPGPERGAAEGRPPLILIPPGGSHTTTWRFNIEPLSQAHEVWTLDLPGSGYSDKPDPKRFAYTHKGYAEIVRDFMQTLNISKAVLIGQSLGGTVALEFALSYPEQTLGVVLIGSGGYSHGYSVGQFNPLVHRSTSAIILSFSCYPAVLRTFFSYMYYNPAPILRESSFISDICSINRTPHAREAYFWMQSGLHFDFALPDPTRIQSVSVPTLLIWGRDDRVVPPKLGERFKEDISGSQLVIIKEAGHCVHEEKPGEVNKAVLSFVEVIVSGGEGKKE